jgi:hypothetical protein
MNPYSRQVVAGTTFLSPTDFYIEVDTLLGEATVVLPSISTIMEIVAKLGITFAGIRIVDISDNASVNNIVILTGGNDLVNNTSSITLNTNGVGGIFTTISGTEWAYSQNSTGGGGGGGDAVILLGGGTGSSYRCGNNNSANSQYSTISGGCENVISGGEGFSTIGGGRCNSASQFGSTISGGTNNTASSSYSAVGGGSSNCSSGIWSVITGGRQNTASGYYFPSIGGGYFNTASGFYSSTVSGGSQNIASNGNSTVIGGIFNIASGNGATVAGGGTNTASNYYSTVSGGDCGTASGYYSVVGGGRCNTASGYSSTISGGQNNISSGCWSSINGGANNTTSGEYSSVVGSSNTSSGVRSVVSGGGLNTSSSYNTVVGGGSRNTSSASYSTVSGGYNNTSSGYYSTVGGGRDNNATGVYSSIGGGSGNTASGSYSAILGGKCNTVSGLYSGSFGCNLNASCNCTFYTNNHCACGSLYTSAISSGCAVCSTTGGQLIGYTPIPPNYGLYAQTANSTPITGTIVESSLIGSGLGTLSVPANGFQVGDSFVVKLYGHITCVGTATIHIRIKSGSVLLADTGIITLDVTTNKHWNIEVNFTIRSLGIASVGSIVSAGLFSYIKNSGLNFEGANFVFLNNTTFDTTILNTLDITAEWNTNNAGNSIYSNIFVLNKIY